jgi:hypothetical protein
LIKPQAAADSSLSSAFPTKPRLRTGKALVDIRYAFQLDPKTEAALEQIARHTFQSKASIMRRYIQEGVTKEAMANAEGAHALLGAVSILSHSIKA